MKIVGTSNKNGDSETRESFLKDRTGVFQDDHKGERGSVGGDYSMCRDEEARNTLMNLRDPK